jgi:mRNA interferase MazF
MSSKCLLPLKHWKLTTEQTKTSHHFQILIAKISMKQNEIWLINLDPAIGAEIKKKRPVIIVSDNAIGKLPLKIIVPITDWKDNYTIAPWMVRLIPDEINGLSKISSADCFQVRSVSEERFVKRIGIISQLEADKIKLALSKVLSIY